MSIKKINGYKIKMEQRLGQGAYGSVYVGEQDLTKNQCAIKIVDKRLVTKDTYLKSALDSEILIMSKLKSENIVGFFDVLMSTHNYYIVQELCDNDLEKYLTAQKDHRLSEAQAIQFLTQICNGFLALVKEGVVHRDLKPANILMNKGKLKIADFGFAKVNVHKKIRNETCVGTPLYMSLAVLKCQGYTSKCDIWSIGCIFYEMLHGHTPWVSKSEYELVEAILNKPLEIDPKLNKRTQDFLIQTLKVNEADRICWDDVFRHKIFKGYFDHYTDENNNFENKYKKVMCDLRFKINSQNLDLQSIWQNLGFELSQNIDFEQFQQFMQFICPQTIKQQKVYFFEKMDPEGKGTINLNYFSQQLQKHQISTKSKYKSNNDNKNQKIVIFQDGVMESIDLNVEQKDNPHFEKRINNCFHKLHKIISNKGLTLYNTFMIHDRNNNGCLKIEQFSKILRKMDSTLTSQQIERVFNTIDKNGTKSINFQQLNNFYCKINGLTESTQRRSSSGGSKQNIFVIG